MRTAVNRGRNRGRALLLLAGLAALCGTGTAWGKTVTYNNVVSPSKLISCYAVPGSSTIECMAPYLREIGELDTYLGLRPRGRSILRERGDFPGYTTRRRTLRYGDFWSRPGMRCAMRKSGLTCRNTQRHGFHIQKDNVRRF